MRGRNELTAILCLVVALVFTGSLSADPPIQLQGGTVTFEQTTDIVTNSAEHVNFPSAERFYDGEIWLYYSYGQHMVSEKAGFRWSLDNGISWAYPSCAVYGMSVTQNPDGSVIGVQINSASEYKTTHTIRWRTWTNPTAVRPEITKEVTFPFSCTAFTHRKLVRLSSGKLLQTLYGTKQGESRLSAFVIQSVNNGITWTYLSTMAGGDDPQVGTEGYNEPSLIQLRDGSLLCLLRTGGGYGNPLMQARSTDEGATWSAPVQIADFGVDPEIVMLSDGTLVASSGRPGVYMLVDFTGTGNNWQRVDVYTSTSTCSYTSLLEVEPNRLLMFYTKSGFSDLWPTPPDGVNRVVGAYVRIAKDPADTPSLTLKTPNGGEKLTSWSTHTIKWESQGNINSVKIEYSLDNGATWTVAATVPNIGEYKWHQWFVPIANSQQCKVRVSDASNPGVSDTSDQVFRIIDLGDSSKWEGKYECSSLPYDSGWTAYGTNVPIHQEDSTSLDSTNGTICVNTYGVYQVPAVIAYWGRQPGFTFNFTEGASVEIRCRVPYSDHWYAASLRFDNNVDANAQLALMSGQGALLNGTATYKGDDFDISKWHTYRITVQNGMANLYVDIPGAKVASIPLAAGKNAVPLLFGDLTGSFMSTMEIDYIRWTNQGAFPIISAPLLLRAPNGGEILTPRSACDIQWNSYDVNVNNVLLQYSTDNGTTWNAIATVPNTGSYRWTVPTADSLQCLIKISDANNASVTDASDQVFIISNGVDSVKWEGKYEANVLPKADGWTGAGTNVPTHQDWSTYLGTPAGTVFVDTKGKYNANSVICYWYKNPAANFSFTNGASVEFRARVPAASAVWSAAALWFDNGVDSKVTLGFIPGAGVQVNGVSTYYPTWLDLSQWHTYRLTVQNGKTNLYIDGPGPRLTDVNVSAGKGAQRLLFGDLTGGGMSTMEIDYVRWTQKGAYPMVDPLPLVLQTLNGGDYLVPGDTTPITWTTNGTIENVNLEYSTDNGATWSVIATVANTGSYSWTVPQTDSTQCLIRISDAANVSVNDVSDASFTISNMIHSASWENRYECSGLPQYQGWTPMGTNVPVHQETSTTVSTTPGAILLDTYGAYNNIAVISTWGKNPLNHLDFTNGGSVEIRCRVPYASQIWSAAALGFDNGVDSKAMLGLIPGYGVRVNDTSSYNPTWLDVTQWHTYRITVKDGKANLYIDASGARLSDVPVLSGISSYAMMFGDLTGGGMSTMEIDYIRWTSQGAYPLMGPGPEAPGELAVAPASQSVDSSAGTATFNVSNVGGSSMTWTAQVVSGAEWLTITSGAGGTDADMIGVSFAANTGAERTATIRVTAPGATGSPKDVTVVQAAGAPTWALSVAPDSQSADWTASTTTFDVANTGGGEMAWTAEVISGAEWLTITSGSGTNAGTISVDVAQNEDTAAARTGTIRITAAGATGSPVDVTVVQAKHPISGDANEDGRVNFSDYLLLSQNFGSSGAGWGQADFNGDGVVNFSDYLVLSQNFGSGGAVSAAEVEQFKAASASLMDQTQESTDVQEQSGMEKEMTAITPCTPLAMVVLTAIGLAFGLLGSLKIEE